MLEAFYVEDIGERDVTTETIFSDEDMSTGQFLVKQQGIFCGKAVIEEAYRLFDPPIELRIFKKDGELVQAGEVIAEVTGKTKDLLMAERVILNLIQRMSGIATLTAEAKSRLGESETEICDTRKTTPGLRMFEKYAVTCGGGKNHRIGLYDGVMIKDNHIAHAGSITKAVQLVKDRIGPMVKIEVETENEQEVLEALEAGADLIMFDNCTPEQAGFYSSLIPPTILTEISGGVDLNNLADYRDCGADFISMGALTHSVKALDISFNLTGGKKNEYS